MADSKNSLVDQGMDQKDPYRAKPGEFPVKKVVGAFGQSADAAGQKNDLAKQSHNQVNVREVETAGGESDSMAEKARNVASYFKIERNKGESSDSASSPNIPESVNFSDGSISSKGYKSTVVGEVPDKMVELGK